MESLGSLRGMLNDREYREEKQKRQEMQKHKCFKCEFANWINAELATCSYGQGCYKETNKRKVGDKIVYIKPNKNKRGY